MYRLYPVVVLLINSITLFGCASRSGFSPQSWQFPIDGKVSSISHVDLAAAIAAANAGPIYAVHIVSPNRVRVDISDDLHKVGNYDEKGRYYVKEFHGNPMYVVVTRVGGKWESGGAIITTY
ncbi:MAG: hypothetical protein DMF39_03245 [Verrucomicrobia bacterium]|nr:MAG: hypothetical protein DMF39_03245 [Verrucomicrobiota bacterium]